MNDQIVQPRDLRLLNIGTYVPLFLITVLGLIVLQDPTKRIIALAICIAFGLNHALRFRDANTYRSLFIHFFLQTALVVTLAVISFPSDAFYFLLFILGIQATMLLPIRYSALWMVAFYLIDSNSVFLDIDSGGIIELLFNGTAMFFTGVLGYSLRQTEIARREKETLIEELKTTQDQLRELAVTEERTRLARELHDSLGHRLTVAVVQLEGAQRLIPIKPDQAIEMIGTMREELKVALADLRLTVSAMRNPITESEPLDSALLSLTQSFQQNTGLVTRFTAVPGLPELPAAYWLVFYRAVQEGLTNIQRHASAQNAWIQLNSNNEEITLTIEDDGKGFEQNTEKGSGVGLLGISERSKQLGGEMRIRDRQGGGTQLVLIIPKPEKRKNND